LLSADETSDAESALLASVSLRVHRRETMYGYGGRHYLSVGLSAIECIDRVVGQDSSPTSVLDFACGYGRVLRFLRVRFPRARLVASDVDARAVRFCRRVLGAEVFLSDAEFDDIGLEDRFALIWCGSLITHLDREAALRLLAFLAAHLADDGTCLVSAHAEVTDRKLREEQGAYGLCDEARRAILEGFDVGGFGYVDYPGHSGYGVSLVARDTLLDMAGGVGLAEASFQPGGWDDHQDAYAFVRTGGADVAE
jgi:SAM-dependent methyltransferase